MRRLESSQVYRELSGDVSVRRMLERRVLSDWTAYQYLQAVRSFSGFLGLKPCEVVERLRGMEPKAATKLVTEWIVAMRKRLAPKTLRNWLGGVRIWLTENDVEHINWSRVSAEFRSRVGPVRTLVNRDYITREELVKILQVAKLRERAWITFAASSGLRVADTILHLKLSNIKDDLWDKSLPCYLVEVPGEYTKEGIPHFTFISAECAEYLRAYLKQREAGGETITPDSYLFVTRLGLPIQPQTIRNIWAELCEKAGVDRKPVQGRFRGRVHGKLMYRNLYNIRVHSLRKYFKTACSTMGVDRMVSEAFLGHSLTSFGIESVYDFCVSRLDHLRTQYQMVLPLVTFLVEPPSVKVVANHKARQEVEQLKAEVRRLEETVRVLTVGLLAAHGLTHLTPEEKRKLQRLKELQGALDELDL